jgi:hypothetical protein
VVIRAGLGASLLESQTLAAGAFTEMQARSSFLRSREMDKQHQSSQLRVVASNLNAP